MALLGYLQYYVQKEHMWEIKAYISLRQIVFEIFYIFDPIRYKDIFLNNFPLQYPWKSYLIICQEINISYI